MNMHVSVRRWVWKADDNNLVLGCAIFGVMLGAAVSVMLTLGVSLRTREPEKLPR
jgi:hypothetical protein